jgi:hypothetical protein
VGADNLDPTSIRSAEAVISLAQRVQSFKDAGKAERRPKVNIGQHPKPQSLIRTMERAGHLMTPTGYIYQRGINLIAQTLNKE